MFEVILAENHNIVRNGVKALLEKEGIKVVAESNNGVEVLNALKNGVEADIIVADIGMPDMDGITLIKEIKNLHPKTHVVILTVHDNDKYVLQAFDEGARGYLLKNISSEELIFCLRQVHAGKRYLCSELSIKLLKKAASIAVLENVPKEFSARELEVLQLIAEGHTNTEMSDLLFISKRTVEGYRQSLIDKTGSKNTATLIRYALVNGIIR